MPIEMLISRRVRKTLQASIIIINKNNNKPMARSLWEASIINHHHHIRIWGPTLFSQYFLLCRWENSTTSNMSFTFLIPQGKHLCKVNGKQKIYIFVVALVYKKRTFICIIVIQLPYVHTNKRSHIDYPSTKDFLICSNSWVSPIKASATLLNSYSIVKYKKHKINTKSLGIEC